MTDTAAADYATVDLVVKTVHQFFPTFDYRYDYAGAFVPAGYLSMVLDYRKIRYRRSRCQVKKVQCQVVNGL